MKSDKESYRFQPFIMALPVRGNVFKLQGILKMKSLINKLMKKDLNIRHKFFSLKRVLILAKKFKDKDYLMK